MSNDFERIEQLAHKLRSVIETVPRQDLPVGMRSFPKGACGNSAILLGAYFTNFEIEGFVYVQGKRGSRKHNTYASHAWLSRETLVVDITADQFSDAPGPVIVADPSPWHQTFRAQELTAPGDYRILWNRFGVDDLYRLYTRLHTRLFPSET
jgi:hypothetical protein